MFIRCNAYADWLSLAHDGRQSHGKQRTATMTAHCCRYATFAVYRSTVFRVSTASFVVSSTYTTPKPSNTSVHSDNSKPPSKVHKCSTDTLGLYLCGKARMAFFVPSINCKAETSRRLPSDHFFQCLSLFIFHEKLHEQAVQVWRVLPQSMECVVITRGYR